MVEKAAIGKDDEEALPSFLRKTGLFRRWIENIGGIICPKGIMIASKSSLLRLSEAAINMRRRNSCYYFAEAPLCMEIYEKI